MKVAPTRHDKMDSTPGRSGDSHPRRLRSRRAKRRVRFTLPSFATTEVCLLDSEDSSRAEEMHEFLSFFWWLVQQIPGIHDIFSSVSFH